MLLTELQAKNSKPRERAYKLPDGEGLFLLVQPNGNKLWRLKYRFGGKEKLLSFGAYQGVGLAAARHKRTAAKALLAEGKDPMRNKAEANPEHGNTFQVVAQRWHENRKSALRMKTGREHLVPLSVQAAGIARSIISVASGDYVFPGTTPDKPLSENTMIYALYRLGYHSRQTVYGFRALASIWANEQLVEFGKPAIWIRRYHEDWVEIQLAHSEKNEVRGAYNAAEYMIPRRRMMQDWADFLNGGKVIDIRTASSRAANFAR